MAETKTTNPLLKGIVTLAVLGFSGYQLYQFFFGPVPACDAEEVQKSLVEIFHQHSQIGTDKITLDSLHDLTEADFADDVRNCQGQLQVGTWLAPFSYNLSWDKRWRRLFLTHVKGNPPGQPSAWYLLDALPTCDSDAVNGVVSDIFAEIGTEHQIPITGVEQLRELSFEATQEIRQCEGLVVALEADGQPGKAPFQYQVDWRDKTTGNFYTQMLENHAP